jgi:hypothetical protein
MSMLVLYQVEWASWGKKEESQQRKILIKENFSQMFFMDKES